MNFTDDLSPVAPSTMPPLHQAYGWLYDKTWHQVELPWAHVEELAADSLRALLETRGYRHVLAVGLVGNVRSQIFEHTTTVNILPTGCSIYCALLTVGSSARQHVVMVADMPALFEYLSRVHGHTGSLTTSLRW